MAVHLNNKYFRSTTIPRVNHENSNYFSKLIDMIKNDPNIDEFHKGQLIKALIDQGDGLDEDEFSNKLPLNFRIFLIEHLPCPIPNYLHKPKDCKQYPFLNF